MIVLIMGPAGSGKTTVGKLLASRLCWEFVDADSFHPPANIEKMSRGNGLTDEDRLPWLESIRAAMRRWEAQNRNVVLACSALKRSYRELLGVPLDQNVKLVYLKASSELLRERLHSRHGHFAGEQLLVSQLSDLEEPTDALILDSAVSPQELSAQIRQGLRLAA